MTNKYWCFPKLSHFSLNSRIIILVGYLIFIVWFAFKLRYTYGYGSHFTPAKPVTISTPAPSDPPVADQQLSENKPQNDPIKYILLYNKFWEDEKWSLETSQIDPAVSGKDEWWKTII